MLQNARIATRLPAQDLARARRFYADKLGLEASEERPGGLLYRAASGEFALFQSAGASPGTFTQMAWEVDDIEATVAELRSRGVVFEEYDMPGLETVDGIAEIEGNYPSKGVGERAAWFRDSEGNMLGIGQSVRASAETPGEDTPDDEQIRALIERWAAAVHAGDMGTVLADHADDIVMFDVPPPHDGVRGLEAYRENWPPFFDRQARGASFEIVSLDVTAGDDVAYAFALLRCGTQVELAKHPETRLRLTIGLRKQEGRWIVAHEHHSFADTSQSA
jgi:uncharacterized protein (TIGR02246 family)